MQHSTSLHPDKPSPISSTKLQQSCSTSAGVGPCPTAPRAEPPCPGGGYASVIIFLLGCLTMTFPFSPHRRAHLLGYARACQAVQNLNELCRRWLESQRPIHQQAVWIAGSEANNSRRTIPVMCRTDNCSNCRLLHYPERNAAQKRETPALRGGVRQMVVAIPSAMQNDKAEPRPKSELHHSRSNLAWSSDRLPPAT